MRQDTCQPDLTNFGNTSIWQSARVRATQENRLSESHSSRLSLLRHDRADTPDEKGFPLKFDHNGRRLPIWKEERIYLSGGLFVGYEKHFGLRARPFRCLPTPGSYYAADLHEHTLTQLRVALEEEEPLLLLSGEPGTGKTLLCHCLLQRMGASRSAFLTQGHFENRAALLQAILYELSLPYAMNSEQELRLALTEDLLKHCPEDGPTLLIVDDAQHLSAELLEELRALTNLEGEQGRAIQILLVGHPSLLQLLQTPSLASFRQRLSLQTQLEPWMDEEAADYLFHHLRLVGGHPERILEGEAVEVILGAAQGIPRLLNRIAHTALKLACEIQAQKVDAEIALESLALLGLENSETDLGEKLNVEVNHVEEINFEDADAEVQDVDAPPSHSFAIAWDNVLPFSPVEESEVPKKKEVDLQLRLPHVVPPRPA